MGTLIMDKPDLTRLLLLKTLEKLPSTRGGEGYFIDRDLQSGYINDIIANLHNAYVFVWGPYPEYPPSVGDNKRYEIARTIIGYHISGLGNGRFFYSGKRLAKSEKEKFVDNLVADFHVYGLFSQQKKELFCKVAKIIANKDEDTAWENKCLKTEGGVL